jgi:hypothetical protein
MREREESRFLFPSMVWGLRRFAGQSKVRQPSFTWRAVMPERRTVRRARRDAAQGKSPSTQAGEFVREEMEHIRQGKHGARSSKQAIAIGLSKARRAGVRLPAGKRTSARTRAKARRDLAKGRRRRAVSRTRSRAVRGELRRERTRAASKRSLARHARTSSRTRSAAARSASARKAARTKGAAGRSAAARKAARTRARNRR